jgi:hypothetical protein
MGIYSKSVEGHIEWIDIKQNIGNRKFVRKVKLFGITLWHVNETTFNQISPAVRNKAGIGFAKSE